ncbi:MAG: 1-deoxy-D-xylulose-5-phosphate synthase [Candidatus Delongbacteria bacterium]|nr:1-deoxy-D-xylulose-5-phosphate synthase [Candidatus Delongbacteria bacterium]
MNRIMIIPVAEFERIQRASINPYERFFILADMCRANTLSTVKLAGSGHLGSSFSSLDIVTLLYYSEMNTVKLGIHHPDRDVFFSSKGHDVPGLYSVLFSLGILPKEKFIRLRRIEGTCGHPDVSHPGIEANSGSLGMGLSKAKGMALGKQLSGRGGRIFVMTGDGELQEGQIYEALQTIVHQRITNLCVIVDHNKVQSDQMVSNIIDLGDLESKFRSFGWHVSRCNGHDFQQLENILMGFNTIIDKPKILIADTIKGRGISFMEHPTAMSCNNGLYRWHSGAPDDESYIKGYNEIIDRINHHLENFNISVLKFEDIDTENKSRSTVTSEYVADAFGQALADIAEKRTDLVVLDADLAADCRLRRFQEMYPDRFIENGIAEQDMVSMAGGLALQGYLPIVNSFAAFLTSRANEQIYNNVCEHTKIIYVSHYSGLIPAGPGQSHQSIRDISLLGSLPGFTIIQPCNSEETRLALHYCINQAPGNCVIRLIIGPSPRHIQLPDNYVLVPGQGTVLNEGSDAVLFAYGPVMLNEALSAAEIIKNEGIGLKIVNMPWLNKIDQEWLINMVEGCRTISVLEDHSSVGGLGDFLLSKLVEWNLLKNKRFKTFGIMDFPAWGTPNEVLGYHHLDGKSLANKLIELL